MFQVQALFLKQYQLKHILDICSFVFSLGQRQIDTPNESDTEQIETNEPCHEIMVLFVLRKLILQAHMCSHPMGLDV